MAEERITQYGETIGFYADGEGSDGERRILDANRQTIGYVNEHGTFDMSRKQVSSHPDAGLLIDTD